METTTTEIAAVVTDVADTKATCAARLGRRSVEFWLDVSGFTTRLTEWWTTTSML